MNRRQHLIGEEESGRVLFWHAREKYDKITSDRQCLDRDILYKNYKGVTK